MIKLEDLSLLDLFPDRITDEDMEAFAYAFDPQLREINDAIIEAVIMTRIMELPEPLVDLLAWQLHVDFYEPLGLDLDIKRTLVQNSIIWHRHKGTKYALESIIRILFFDDFSVDEWFEYDGRPYFFRIVSNVSFTGNAAQLWERHRELFLAIWELKNERSWLDYIMFIKEVDPIPVVVVGKLQHAVKHFHHPGDREITQRHNHDDVPLIVVGIAQHAVKHISAVSDRNVTQEHEPDATPVIPAIITKHAVQHTVTAKPRDPNRPHDVASVLAVPTAKAVHAVKHMATPVRNTMAESLMYLEIEGEGIVQGFVEVNDITQPGFVEIITEGA